MFSRKGGSDGKESACNARDRGSTPGSERSPGEGNGHPLHYSCLKNSSDRRAWRATVDGVARARQDWLTNTHRDTQFAMLWKLFMILPIRVRQYHEGFSLFSIHIREIGEDFCDEDLIACNVQWISLSPEFQKLNLCFYKWLLFFIWIFSIYINPMENTP